MKFLTGYKTYIVGVISILLGVGGLFGLLPESVQIGDPATLISVGFASLFLRSGMNSAAGK